MLPTSVPRPMSLEPSGLIPPCHFQGMKLFCRDAAPYFFRSTNLSGWDLNLTMMPSSMATTSPAPAPAAIHCWSRGV